MSTVRITIEGTSPMLQHNVRLANPLDPYTRDLKQLTGKRGKTDDDLARIMHVEARGAAYETPDGILGLPDCNLWRSMLDAAKAFKRGKDIERALIYDPVRVVPLDIDGKTYPVEDFLQIEGSVDYRPVAIAGRKTMRARPIIAKWRSTHEYELLPDVIMLDDIRTIVERAGRLHGVGDHRPQYGRYNVVDLQEVA